MRFAFTAAPTMSAGGSSPGLLFAARCMDKPSSTGLRAANRSAHLEWIASQQSLFRFAGPLRSSPTSPPIGSLLILHGTPSDTVSTVSHRLEADPYAQAGLFDAVQVRRWVCGMASDAPLPGELYAVWCVDGDGKRELRKETRSSHLDWWRGAGRKGMIGPFPAEDGEGAVGSLIVCEGESVEEVREWAKSDPYNQVGLFDSVFVAAVAKTVEEGKLVENV